jgi:hypothetical protein
MELARVGWYLVVMALAVSRVAPAGELAVRVGTFEVDASPPVGSPLAYDPTKGVQMPLSCRGIVLAGGGQPIVLCAVDWIGIGNGGQRVFREALAEAAGTVPERVAVHTLHQHDAPRCDFSAEELLAEHGLNDDAFDDRFLRDVVRRAAEAVAEATGRAKPVTHIGLGQAPVEKVASNRRILGPDGKVQHVRWTATKDPEIRAAPVGTIDPDVRIISFWNGDEPLAALTYYATHPQSYYRTGLANPDFPGMARNQRQEATGVFHVHFNGAGGNIGAGKWNDGAPENRQILADRVADGMRRAWEANRKAPLASADVGWRTVAVALPAAAHLDEEQLIATLADESAAVAARTAVANDLVWLRRTQAGDTIDLACLKLGAARVLFMPGELFVEYQLAAQQYRPDLFVAMAAYGDYGPGYIGTEIGYGQGGYETSPRASLVASEVEDVLVRAMRQLLEVDADAAAARLRPSDIRNDGGAPLPAASGAPATNGESTP